MEPSVQLLKYDSANSCYFVTPEGLDRLSNLPEKPVKVISVIGKYRLGKSFLLNCLLDPEAKNTQNHFSTSDSTQSETLGIWLNHLDKGSHIELYLDTQGTDDISTTVIERVPTLLASFLSSIILHLVNRVPAKDDFLSLGLIPTDGRNYSTKVLWCLRNYQSTNSFDVNASRNQVEQDEQITKPQSVLFFSKFQNEGLQSPNPFNVGDDPPAVNPPVNTLRSDFQNCLLSIRNSINAASHQNCIGSQFSGKDLASLICLLKSEIEASLGKDLIPDSIVKEASISFVAQNKNGILEKFNNIMSKPLNRSNLNSLEQEKSTISTKLDSFGFHSTMHELDSIKRDITTNQESFKLKVEQEEKREKEEKERKRAEEERKRRQEELRRERERQDRLKREEQERERERERIRQRQEQERQEQERKWKKEEQIREERKRQEQIRELQELMYMLRRPQPSYYQPSQPFLFQDSFGNIYQFRN